MNIKTAQEAYWPKLFSIVFATNLLPASFKCTVSEVRTPLSFLSELFEAI
jgi:hypothetical protein